MSNVVVVDAYAPTRGLAPEFRRAGYEVVRVLSTPEPPLVYRTAFDTSPYVATIAHDGDLADTLAAVAAFDPVAVVAAGESGVEFADQLSEALDVATNGTALSPARRDKYAQTETVRAAGLRAAEQLLVTSAEPLRQWHAQRGGQIVVKPVRSAAGDHVAFCHAPAESVAAYEAILASDNVFSMPNTAAVAQEYLCGGEYVVNTVSCNGQHHVTDFWKYVQITLNGITDLSLGSRLMPRHGEVQEQLAPYAFDVLDALGIAHGAAHMEVRLTPTGPCLVEVGARMAGLGMPYFTKECIGETQIEWIVDAYVRPERFAERWKNGYELRRHFVSAMTASPVDGILRSYPLLPVVEQLKSFHSSHAVVAPGDRLRRTVDDITCPLVVNFSHEVEEIVDRDFGTLRYLDGPSFYDLEPSP